MEHDYKTRDIDSDRAECLSFPAEEQFRGTEQQIKQRYNGVTSIFYPEKPSAPFPGHYHARIYIQTGGTYYWFKQKPDMWAPLVSRGDTFYTTIHTPSRTQSRKAHFNFRYLNNYNGQYVQGKFHIGQEWQGDVSGHAIASTTTTENKIAFEGLGASLGPDTTYHILSSISVSGDKVTMDVRNAGGESLNKVSLDASNGELPQEGRVALGGRINEEDTVVYVRNYGVKKDTTL